MSETTTIEIHVCISESGDYGTGNDSESAATDYEDRIGSLIGAGAVRYVVCRLTVPLPKPTILTGTAPAERERERL